MGLSEGRILRVFFICGAHRHHRQAMGVILGLSVRFTSIKILPP